MDIHMDIHDRGSLRPRVLEAQVPSVPRSHRSQGPIGPPKVSHPKVSHPRDPWEPIYGYPYMDIHIWISIYGYPYMGTQGSLGWDPLGWDTLGGPMGPWDRWDL